MTSHVFLVVSLLGAAPSLDGVKRSADGTLEARYRDAAGAHTVTFRFGKKAKKVGDDVERTLTMDVADVAGKKTVWKAKDFVQACAFDATLEVDDASIAVTDLDGDGLAEFAFVYSLGCRSDVSPLTVKLLMYEGATKYALRGESRERVGETEWVGGTFTPDPAISGAPAAFLERAKATWNERVLRGN